MSCGLISHGTLNAVCGVIYDFQTLLTGALAIGVAIIAGVPVWRQLKDSNLQTRISHRETLITLLRDTLSRNSKVKNDIREPMIKARRATTDHCGDPIEIHPEDAHSLEMDFRKALDWYLVSQADTDDHNVEIHKLKLKISIDKLIETLSDAHYVHSNDQSDEYRSYTNGEWAEKCAQSERAKLEASERVGEVAASYRSLEEAQKLWIRALRKRIAELDRQIVGSK